jgi:hypothetical protein
MTLQTHNGQENNGQVPAAFCNITELVHTNIFQLRNVTIREWLWLQLLLFTEECFFKGKEDQMHALRANQLASPNTTLYSAAEANICIPQGSEAET